MDPLLIFAAVCALVGAVALVAATLCTDPDPLPEFDDIDQHTRKDHP